MKVHDLKTLPEYFEAVDSGAKPFEVRFNDRDFKAGDVLNFREYSDGEYTGRVLRRKVTYVLDDQGSCKEGFVVLGLAPIERVAETSEEKRIEVRSCEDCLHYRACLVNSEYVPTPCCAYENKQGYRKQSEGEWIVTDADSGSFGEYEPFIEFKCPECGVIHGFESGEYDWQYGDPIPWVSCPCCGAKMKGGAE